ncbi:hypothetical protein CAEBREN_01718 [Caenorhabditis brenneri]|uniref:Uncharacterized protein n=1 Tax=Caenorhabditis brenneri TaxID=135651 RepID=G0NF08_CAEBE|nr:hypothetical protein CAEBREN_01718 [Caenorhabditis brenneri]
MRPAEMLVVNSIFWLCGCVIANLNLYWKLKRLRRKSRTFKFQKGEQSLLLITCSMLPAYMTNLALVVAFLINPAASAYFLAIRPYGSDCDFVFVPWIFYLTHPLFKAAQVAPRVNSNTII